MTDLHSWETVYDTKRAIGGFATMVHRFRVPNGWLYVHTLIRLRWFRSDERHISTVFVPDPSS